MAPLGIEAMTWTCATNIIAMQNMETHTAPATAETLAHFVFFLLLLATLWPFRVFRRRRNMGVAAAAVRRRWSIEV